MEIIQVGIISKSIALLSGQSLNDRLVTASLNTIIGLGVVFAVLILITLIIYLFKFFPYLQNRASKKANNVVLPPVSSVDHVIAQIVEKEEEALNEDFGLVAVITAALYASMGDAVPKDGLIVRSIRKVNYK